MKIALRPVVAALAVLLVVSLVINALLIIERIGQEDVAPGATTAAVPPAGGTPKPAENAPAKDGEFAVVQSNFDRDANRLRIHFSQPVSLSAIKPYIEADPAVDLRLNSYYGAQRVDVSGDFEAESFYTVILKKGLPSGDGKLLDRDIKLTLVTGAAEPYCNFATQGAVFPVDRSIRELPLKLRNVEDIEVELLQFYPGKATDSPGNYRWSRNSDSRSISRHKFHFDLEPNRWQYRSLPLDEILPDREPGLYALQLIPRDGWNRPAQTLAVTDLGIAAAASPGKVLTMVRTLSDASPAADAEVLLYSEKDQLLAEGTTDEAGTVLLNYDALFDPDDRPARVVVNRQGDYSFLELQEYGNTRHNLSEFATGGTPPPALDAPVRAFLHAERGIMRPGESIRLYLQLRDAESFALPEPQPVEFRVYDPRNREFLRRTVETDDFGMAELELSVGPEDPTGYYLIGVGLPGAKEEREFWDRSQVLVTSYTPDSFRLTLTAAETEAEGPGEFSVTGDARYYFNEPVADREVKTDFSCDWRPFASKKYPGYGFAFPEKSRPQLPRNVSVTDAEGRFRFSVADPVAPGSVPNNILATSAWSSATAADNRTVSAGLILERHYNPFYLGLKEGNASENGIGFSWVAVTPGEEPYSIASAELEYHVDAVNWNYLLRERDGKTVRVWEEETVPEVSGAVPAGGDSGSFTVPLKHPGHYRIQLIDPASGVACAGEFYYYYGDGNQVRSNNPTVLAFTTDRDRYLPGDTAQVTLDLPSDGVILAAAGGEAVRQAYDFQGVAGSNTIAVAIPADLRTGSWYVGVTAILNDPAGKREPDRRFGLLRLTVDQRASRLDIDLETPAEIEPASRQVVKVTLRDADGNPVQGQVRLWAVDAGVLALTDWQTPDPHKHFFGPNANAIRFYDLYGMIYPALAIGPDGLIGGGAAGSRNRFMPEEYRQSAVVSLPPMLTDEEGVAVACVDWPEHTGAMRLMASAVAADAVGSAEAEIVLRREISTLLSLPRAVAPGDEFEVTAVLFNHTGETRSVTCRIMASGNVELGSADAEKIEIAPGGNVTLKRLCRAKAEPGPAAFVVRTEAGDKVHDERGVFSIRPAAGEITVAASHVIGPGESLGIAPDESGFYPGTVEHTLTAGSSPAVGLSRSLDWLNRYPYGCTEQVTAGAFPFLVLPSLVKAGVVPESFAGGGDDKIRRTLKRLAQSQLYNGGFPRWSGGNDEWPDASLFVMHFIFEAGAAGYTLPERLREAGVGYLASLLDNRRLSLEQRAYACYLMALSGKPAAGYAREILASAPEGGLARFYCAAALYHSGDAAEAAEMMKTILDARPWRIDSTLDGWTSQVRRLGIMLWIAVPLLPDHPELDVMAAELGASLERDCDTQGNAWCVLGLGRWAAYAGVEAARGSISGGGERTVVPEGRPAVVRRPGPLMVDNDGPGKLYVKSLLRGIPKEVEAYEHNLVLRRRYLDAEGNETDAIKVGDLLTVELRVSGTAPVGDLAVVDLLPGGVEIEDERLATRANLPRRPDDPQENVLYPIFVEKLDDRLNLFTDLAGGREQVYTYRVRAVNRGVFQLPPVTAEAMYDTGVGAVAVFEGQNLRVE